MTNGLPAACVSARAALVLDEPGPRHSDRIEAERHIEECEACRLFRTRERRTAEVLRSAAAWETARAGDQGRAPVVVVRGRQRRRVAPAALAAAAAFVVGVAVSALLMYHDRSRDVVGAIFRDHAKYLVAARPADVLSSDPRAIAAWSQRELGFEPQLVRPDGFDLLGARRCTISGNTVALIFYQKERCRISLLVGEPGRWPPLPGRASSAPIAFVTAVHDRLVYVAVGDAGEEELMRLVPAGPPA